MLSTGWMMTFPLLYSLSSSARYFVGLQLTATVMAITPIVKRCRLVFMGPPFFFIVSDGICCRVCCCFCCVFLLFVFWFYFLFSDEATGRICSRGSSRAVCTIFQPS